MFCIAAKAIGHYFVNGLFTLTRFAFELDFKATSSFLALTASFEVKDNNITTKMGTNSSRKGDTFINFFMIVFFDDIL